MKVKDLYMALLDYCGTGAVNTSAPAAWMYVARIEAAFQRDDIEELVDIADELGLLESL